MTLMTNKRIELVQTPKVMLIWGLIPRSNASLFQPGLTNAGSSLIGIHSAHAFE